MSHIVVIWRKPVLIFSYFWKMRIFQKFQINSYKHLLLRTDEHNSATHHPSKLHYLLHPYTHPSPTTPANYSMYYTPIHTHNHRPSPLQITLFITPLYTPITTHHPSKLHYVSLCITHPTTSTTGTTPHSQPIDT